ncbi:MAG: polyprenyl diphosphate synthase [Hadesarchaea archaeon]|jgi:tritrans,polycis-undecaprenyl-diphosphate synthase [geranylgeranyl-diphosphate specific]|nr:polyprenyl diphosphate synthase [Hadesarchaea archaeon]TDA33559.1 MAG: di-trans,poly-cis-decaprenylcistransferase [Hadesarchaea archaeon]
MRPQHLGLIPDGNRRWAREHGLEIWQGHERGVRVLEDFFRWCLEEDIPEVTVYTLSLENLERRSPQELQHLYRLMNSCLRRLEGDRTLHEHEVRVRVVGRLHRLPDFLLAGARRVMEATRHYQRRHLNFLIAYGAQDELLSCVRRLLSSRPARLTRQVLERYLWVRRPLDMVIRTGKEHRLSNFLLYQAAYAELFFVDKYWPDFTREDLRRCLEEFERRQRRMGS